MKRTGEMMLTLGGLTGIATSGMAAMTIWLLLTQPLTVANAVNARDLTMLATLVRYL
jgi:hypothetical protein